MAITLIRTSGLAVLLACFACTSSDAPQALLQQWAITPDLRIGAVEGGEDALSEIGELLIGPNGDMYVSQPGERTIKVFDSTGQFVRRVGREGRGPGEFGLLSRMSWLGDTLVVIDARLRRISFFDRQGASLGDQSVIIPPTGAHMGSSVPLAVLPDGMAIGLPGFSLEDVAEGRVTGRPLVLIDRASSILDTVAVLGVSRVYIIRRGNHSIQGGQPFSPVPLVRVHPSGQSTYLLEFPDSSGSTHAYLRATRLDGRMDTVYSRVHGFPAVPVPQTARDSVIESVVSILARGEGSPLTTASAANMARDALEIPDTYPAADGAFADEDGRLWIRRLTSTPGLVTWEVLGPNGELTAQMAAPASAQLRYARGTWVWGIELDSLDIPYVVRYRIVDQ